VWSLVRLAPTAFRRSTSAVLWSGLGTIPPLSSNPHAGSVIDDGVINAANTPCVFSDCG
jgi:hypothetical protein